MLPIPADAHAYKRNYPYRCRAAQHGVCAIRLGSAPTRYTWRSTEKIADFLPEIIYNCLFIYSQTHTQYTYTCVCVRMLDIFALFAVNFVGRKESKTQRAQHALAKNFCDSHVNNLLGMSQGSVRINIHSLRVSSTRTRIYSFALLT